MSGKEAKSRIKINKLLEESGWLFFPKDGRKANNKLEKHVKIEPQDLKQLGEDFEKSQFLDEYRNIVNSIIVDLRYTSINDCRNRRKDGYV